MTHSSRKWLASAPCFPEKWLFTFHLIPYYKYPYTHQILRASRENFERETLEKNKIDSSIILYIWFSKIPLLSPSPLSYPWEDYKPNPYLTKFRVVRKFLVFGKQFMGEPILIGWYNRLIARSRKLEKIWFGIILLKQET